MLSIVETADPSRGRGRTTRLTGRAIETPLGALPLVASDAGLVAVLWPRDRPGRVALEPVSADGGNPHLTDAADQLAAYFAGRRQTFEVALDLRGTPFELAVWAALRAIPFGQTRSYRDMAEAIGRPSATRAVGAANGRNPISIIVPCHRVVGADGSLTGFAGGIEIKRQLLALEGSGSGRLI